MKSQDSPSGRSPWRRIKRNAHRRFSDLHRTLLHAAAWWWKPKTLREEWAINTAIGLFVECLLHISILSTIVAGHVLPTMDLIMQVQAATGWSDVSVSKPIIMFDVDDETWRDPAWGGGEPYRAPREPLTKLIDFAFRHGARDVVLDIILDGPAGSDDEVMRSYLQALPAKLKLDQHLLLVRTLRAPLYAEETLAPVLRSTPFDRQIAQSNGRIVDVAPYFLESKDGVVRSWRLWRGACDVSRSDGKAQDRGLGRWIVLPSVQLAIARLKHPSNGLMWPQFAPASCLWSAENLAVSSSPTNADIEKQTMIWLQAHPELSQPKFMQALLGGAEPSTRIHFLDGDPPVSGRIRVISAIKILQPNPAPLASLKDAVVIIGQSSEAARDVHNTPLGPMPGSLILANAINSFLSQGLIWPVAGGLEVLISSIFVVLTGLAFACFERHLFIDLVLDVIFFLVFLLIGLKILDAGYWFDFGVPLLGIIVYRTLRDFEDFVLLKKWKPKHIGAEAD